VLLEFIVGQLQCCQQSDMFGMVIRNLKSVVATLDSWLAVLLLIIIFLAMPTDPLFL